MNRRFWMPALWLGLGAALFVTAYLLVNTTFMFYDDEGYLLLTYKNFLSGARLYDDIFSQYGPWPYLFHQLVTTILHQPLTHTLGRNITAFNWTLCALLCGLMAHRVTGKAIAGLCTTLITFGMLWQMNAEPSHPGSLICAMLATVALTALLLHGTAQWNWLGASLGCMAALLILTKINIGLLFVAGAGAGALRMSSWPERWRKPADLLATLGLLAVPWGLMSKKLGDPWVLNFAIQFTAGAAGLLWITPPAVMGRPIPPRTWRAALVVFVATICVTAAAVCAQGTSLHALLQTVLFDPLRQPGSFMYGFTWKPEIWPVAIVCWLTTAWAGWELRRNGAVGRVTRFIVIAVRLTTMVEFLLNAWVWLTIYGVGGFIVFCLPLLPVFLVPLGPAKIVGQGESNGRLWLAYLALPQVLHAFPVAGSQMGWGTFLLLPTMVIGLGEAWLALAWEVPKIGLWLPRIGWSALLLVSAWQFQLLATNGWQRYVTSKPLNLPGAEDIRLDGPARLILKVLTTNAAVHADVLFSRPGMFSYNQWSGVPTPTTRNATHWFWLLDEPAQAKIIEQLRHTPRSAIITNQNQNDFLKSINVPVRGPLPAYIEKNYRPLFDENSSSLQSFQFLVPLKSRAVPFDRIDVRGLDKPAVGEKFPFLFRTNIVLDGVPAKVQLISAYAPWTVLFDFMREESRISLEPITPQGDSIGPAIQLPVTRSLKGLYRMTIFLSKIPKTNGTLGSALSVIAPDGTVLSESVL